MSNTSGVETVASLIEPSWQERCQHWRTLAALAPARRRRERESRPLILTGHGLSVRVDRGCLLIRDGNTHYPAQQREWRFFKGGLDIPPAFVIVDGSGEITLDAMDWLATQDVAVIRIRWDGRLSSIITSGGQAANPDLVRWQADTRDSPRARAEFALDVVRRKTEATIETMESHVPRSKTWDSAMYGIQRRVSVLEKLRPNSIVDVLGWEAGVAADYYRAWSGIKLHWRITKRNPIPKDWLKYTTRAALNEQRTNRNATHPINAMLNYAYTVLIGSTQIELIGKGYDPTLGIFHDDRKRRGTYPAFALDWMEPMRPVVDRGILDLIQGETLTGADFSIQDDGVCRLNPELARWVAGSANRSIAASRP